MPFLEVSLAPTVAFGFRGGPEMATTIVSLESGREQRNIKWSSARHRYSAPFQNINEAAYRTIKAMFLVCYGQAYGFRFKDWADYQATDALFGQGDGATRIFQLYIVSVEGAASYSRKIIKPVSAGFTAYVNGTPAAATVDTTTGLVTFATVPLVGTVLTWSGAFDVPVRFALDYIPFSIDEFHAMNGTLDLIEDPEA